MFRKTGVTLNVVNLHGYLASKKGNRRRVELLEKLKGVKGLNRKKKNILGGNFNFVDNDKDRKSWAAEVINKEKPVKDKFVPICRDFKIYVRFLFYTYY